MKPTDIIEQAEPPLEDGVVLPLDEEAEMQEHFGIFRSVE